MLDEKAGINRHGQKTSQTSLEQQQLIGNIDTGKNRHEPKLSARFALWAMNKSICSSSQICACG